MLDGDGVDTALSQLVHQLGHTGLDVVGDFSPSVLSREISAHIGEIAAEQFVGILVNGIQDAKHIDGYVLFHFCVQDFNRFTVVARPFQAASS